MERSGELRCLRVAATQDGVVCRAQARELGLSERQIEHRVRTGRWEALFPAVYRVEGSARTLRQKLRGALLWAGRGAALSHRAAAALLGFARFELREVELSVPWDARLPPPAIVHRVAALPPRELRWIDGLTVTSPTRTLVDLSAAEDPRTLRASVDEALRRRWTTLDKLQAAVSQAARQRGVVQLREIVSRLAGGEAPAESELEARVAELLEAAGFPRPVRQQVVRVRGGVRRIDFRVPGTPIVIEADGYAYHSGFDTFESQRNRHRELGARGLFVVPWTWAAVRDHPEVLIAQLRETVANLGRR